MNYVIEINEGKRIPSHAILFPGKGLKYKGGMYKIDNISILTQENSKAILGTVGGAALGTLALGPIGLVAGALAGGNRNKTTLVIECQQGPRLIGTVPTKHVGGIFAAAEERIKQPIDFDQRVSRISAMKSKLLQFADAYKNGSFDEEQRSRIDLILFIFAILFIVIGIIVLFTVNGLAGVLFLASVLFIFVRISKHLNQSKTTPHL